MTKAVSKQLLPIYDKPLIYYPPSMLLLAGIREVLIISTPDDMPVYQRLFGTVRKSVFAWNIKCRIRREDWLFILGENFIGDDSVCLILGDNVFFGQNMSQTLWKVMDKINDNSGACIYGYPVKDARAFAVVEFDEENKIVSIKEKPAHPRSNYAVPELYFYDNRVIEIAKNVEPSVRGKIEITALNNANLELGELNVQLLGRGVAWLDTGTPEDMLKAAVFVEAV
ncbi:sugar phosphate nucleotidyltransferase [Holdemania filiformis]|uniref:sugar phosphate nucleotidyltransferase n=1 Tax=Holdemania filiformis TaxID=61171 RepID=UPI0024312CA4|nr:sugar phosphate nucleotidyltransferase [Holdemania filiformis]